MPVEPVGQKTERDTRCRIGPTALAAKARMPERFRGIGAPEAAQIGFAVSAGNGDPQGPVGPVAEEGVAQFSGANAPRLFQHFRLPDRRPVVGMTVVQQGLVE